MTNQTALAAASFQTASGLSMRAKGVRRRYAVVTHTQN